jgi:hypothetical protein
MQLNSTMKYVFVPEKSKLKKKKCIQIILEFSHSFMGTCMWDVVSNSVLTLIRSTKYKCIPLKINLPTSNRTNNVDHHNKLQRMRNAV